jgi:16S rRNA (cytosine967-C5)-methyltransferase
MDAPVRAALRLAGYERWVLDTPLHAIAGEYAGLMRGEKVSSATAFVNAIARKLGDSFRELPRQKAFRLHVQFSHPLWLVERYLERFGEEEAFQLLQANNERAPLCLRVNTLKAKREDVLIRVPHGRLSELSPDGIICEENFDPTTLQSWERGELFAQDEAAQLVSLYASPKQGDFIIDCAGAPGGKATHCAQLIEDKGRILVCDLAAGRLKLVKDNAKRLGINCIETMAGDIENLAPQLRNKQLADLVLLDAPCLGTGTFRRRPDAKWRKTPEQLDELVALQEKLLDAAATMVKPGGALVYSTCSLEIEENAAQALKFAARSGWNIEKAHDFLGAVREENGFLQSWPHKNGCDGMFAAKFRRPVE